MLSKSKRYLTEAKEQGIVQIRIAEANEAYRVPTLEDALKTKYKLSDCVVAASVPTNNYYYASAEYINSILPKSGTIAIGGGTTLYFIGQYLDKMERRVGESLVCIQSTGIVNESVPSTAVVQTWSMKLGATPIYMSYPGIMRNMDVKAMMMDDAEFVEKYHIMKKADICVFGIGTIPQYFSSGANVDTLTARKEEIAKDCLGDICFHLFDRNGDFCFPELSEYVCGLSPVDFLRIPVRIAGAFGPEKVMPLHCAMNGRLMNILVTDEPTATALLEIEA